MTSADLTPSATWQQLAPAIGRKFRAGEPFEDILEMNVAIKQRDLRPYEAHRARLDELLWYDDPKPKRIIEIGAGYGAMATFWPEGSTVVNIDLPEMLEVQAHYLQRVGVTNVELVPYTEADSVDFKGAYVFSVWALTETTPETWRYYASRVRDAAGIYLLGHTQWEQYERWPWEDMAAQFPEVRVLQHPHSVSTEFMELAAVRRAPKRTRKAKAS